jgi:uncharacterized protein with ATP-grasp and redox domains
MMRLALDCIPCFARHSLEMARAASSDGEVHERVLRETLRELAEWDGELPAPALSQRVQRRLRELTGVQDPYREAKRRFNAMALELLPELRRAVEEAADPFGAAVGVAIAGNVMDLGVDGNLRAEDVRERLERSAATPVEGDLEAFRAAIGEAREVLYLADNAGEIVFDRLLVERLKGRKVTVAVRGGPTLNDATMEDARLAGLDGVAELMGNGSDAPGTLLGECSAEFRERFGRADVVVAKGQGNFETLAGTAGNLFFLLKVKCAALALHTGHKMGTHVLLRQREAGR